MIKQALNHTSRFSFEHRVVGPLALHKHLYQAIRAVFGLRSQMTQSVFKTVAAKYRLMKSNGVAGTLAVFKKPEYDLVWGRDYALANGQFSLNTLEGRVKVSFQPEGMERYFDGTWCFGTAKLVVKKGKFYLHIPMSKEVDETDWHRIRNIVGIDVGINFLATSYDSAGKTVFVSGKQVKARRAHYANVRKSLQQRQTPAARRRLKAIGNRENRWMSDVNHQLSKALVKSAGKDSLLVLENLTGVRRKTEKVRLRDRYVSVSWAFGQLRRMIEYKAALYRCKVIAVDPAYTSRTCPKCLQSDKANRIKSIHTFRCRECGYTTNDDRVAAMNLRQKGIEYLSK